CTSSRVSSEVARYQPAVAEQAGVIVKQSNRRNQPGTTDPLLVLWAVVAVTVIIGLIVFLGGLPLGYLVDGLDRARISANPVRVVVDLAQGLLQWTAGASVAASVIGAVLLFFVVVFIIDRIRVRRRRLPIDQAARHMGHGKDVKPFSEKEIRKKATGWGVESTAPGIPIGKSV